MLLHHPPLKPKHQKRFNPIGLGDSQSLMLGSWKDFAGQCTIRSGTKYIFFHPYYYQSALVDLIEARRFTLIAKTRQLGISELICNLFLWKAIADPGYVAVIFSKKQADTSNLARRVKKQLFPFLSSGRIFLETDNLTDISIAGGGRLMFANSSPNGIRSVESVSDLLLDEWSFVEDAEQIFDSVLPALELVGEASRVIINSTPNGRNGHYWDLLNTGNGQHDVDNICRQIREREVEPFQYWVDESGWNKCLLHWLAHPIYSLEPDTYLEKKSTQLKMSAAAIQREFNLSFDNSDQTIFSYEAIERAAVGRFSSADDLPEGTRFYMGVDCSTIGDDYFCAVILAQLGNKLSVVSLYRKRKISMERHLDSLGYLIEEYLPAVGIEVTGGVGQLYLEGLSKSYPAAHFQSINTSEASKSMMIERSVHAQESGKLQYPIGVLSEEHRTFVRLGQTKQMGASGSCHDDSVMALAFALAISPFATDASFLEIPTFDTYGN